MKILDAGDDALLVVPSLAQRGDVAADAEAADADAGVADPGAAGASDAATDVVLGLWRALIAAAPSWLVAAQPAYLSLHVVFDGSVDAGVVRGFLSTLRPRARVGEVRVVDVPVVYDGADLEFVADHCGLCVDEVVERHTAARYRVAFMGFVPGFAYLLGLDDKLRGVPRLPTPRARVPVGAVGLTGDQTGVYPSSTPGGWRLIGRALRGLGDAAPDDVVQFHRAP